MDHAGHACRFAARSFGGALWARLVAVTVRDGRPPCAPVLVPGADAGGNLGQQVAAG